MTDLTLKLTNTKENFIKLRNILVTSPKVEEFTHIAVAKIDSILNPVTTEITLEKPAIVPTKSSTKSKS